MHHTKAKETLERRVVPGGRGLEFRVYPDFEGLSQAAAVALLEGIRSQPGSLLCLPTGSSPARLYELLVDAHRREPTLFALTRIIKLDEWGGLAMDDPASCEGYLQARVLRPLGIPPERYFAWQSRPADPVGECARVSTWLATHGPIDLCLLGVGANGHLALNEPDEALYPHPHIARLTPESLRHGMLQHARTPPRFGLTLGLADLLQSRRIVVLASGAAKAEPLQRLSWGEVFLDCPATFLWLHPRVTVFCDREAARLI